MLRVGISHSVRSNGRSGRIFDILWYSLPEKMLLTALKRDEIEQVILHELAHIRRYDDWTILLQQLAQGSIVFSSRDLDAH